MARLAPVQPWRSWHRLQHFYIWPVYGFMALKNLLFTDFKNLATRRIGTSPCACHSVWGRFGRIVGGKALHVGWAIVLPLLFNPWWGVLLFYVAVSWLVGFVLAVTFQLAHCVEGVEFTDPASPYRGDEFVPHQLRTTTDVVSPVPVLGHAFRWLVGGLDHQIEHHLAPRLPNTIYATLGTRFSRGCRHLGAEYRVHASVWAGLRSHARWLKQMGEPQRVDC